MSGVLDLGDAASQRRRSPDNERGRIIAAVRRWVDEHGRPPRMIDWDPALARHRGRPELAQRFLAAGAWPNAARVRRHFHSWTELLRAAGYAPLPRRNGRYRAEWTGVEILAAVRRWNELHGDPPTMADWDPYRAQRIGQSWRIQRYDAGDWPSVKTVRKHFGRLSDAIASAGLTPRRQGQRQVQDPIVLDPSIQLHVATVRGFGDRREPAQRLTDSVRLVAAARSRGEAADLRVALVEVAAAAMDWAARS